MQYLPVALLLSGALFLSNTQARPSHTLDDRSRSLSTWSGWMPGSGGMTMFSTNGDDPWGMQTPPVWKMGEDGHTRPFDEEEPPKKRPSKKKSHHGDDEEDGDDSYERIVDDRSRSLSTWSGWMPGSGGMTMFSTNGDDPWGMQTPPVWKMGEDGHTRPFDEEEPPKKRPSKKKSHHGDDEEDGDDSYERIVDDRSRSLSTWSGWMPGSGGMTMFSTNGDDPWGMQTPPVWKMGEDGHTRPFDEEEPPKKRPSKKKSHHGDDEEDGDDSYERIGSRANASFNAWFPILLGGGYPGSEDEYGGRGKGSGNRPSSQEREGVAAVANSVNHGRSGVASSHAIIYSGEPESYRRKSQGHYSS